MHIGSTIVAVKSLAEMMSHGYERVTTIREEVTTLQQATTTTAEGVAQLSSSAAAQREVLEAIADDGDIDTDSVLTEESPAETPDNG